MNIFGVNGIKIVYTVQSNLRTKDTGNNINYRFLKDCSNLMKRMNCMRWRIHGDNIVSLLHGITSFVPTNQQSSKFT